MEYPLIADFYAGKTVALTGGTGFVGQAVIEKLLRECPDVKKIILLIRNKRGVDPEERLDQLVMKPAFEKLRKIDPSFRKKLAFVSCDLEAEDLGLSKDGRKMLVNEVNIFIHSAATLKFNEAMRIAFNMNVQCTRRLMKVFRSMKNIQVYVHISTGSTNIFKSLMTSSPLSAAYVNCNRFEGEVEEKVYPSRICYKDMEHSLKWMKDETIEKMLGDILEERPNTYTLTKAMAEEAVINEIGEIPCCIARPGIITASIKDPVPGWIGNLYGPTGLMAANMKGVCRLCIGDPSCIMDLVPVDFIANGIIASAMKTAIDAKTRRRDQKSRASIDSGTSEAFHNSKTVSSSDESDTSSIDMNHYRKEPAVSDVPVYHLSACGVNPINLQGIIDGLNYWNEKTPAVHYVPLKASIDWNRNFYKFRSFLIEYLPSVYLDMLAKLSGQRQGARPMYTRLRAGMNVLEFFFRNCFGFQWKRSKNLLYSLHPKDQQTYNFDPRTLDWRDYLGIYYGGIKKYVLREKSSVENNLKRQARVNQAYDIASNLFLMAAGIVPASFGVTNTIWESTSYN